MEITLDFCEFIFGRCPQFTDCGHLLFGHRENVKSFMINDTFKERFPLTYNQK